MARQAKVADRNSSLRGRRGGSHQCNTSHLKQRPGDRKDILHCHLQENCALPLSSSFEGAYGFWSNGQATLILLVVQVFGGHLLSQAASESRSVGGAS